MNGEQYTGPRVERHNGHRSPAEIQRDIERTRQDMERTIDALRSELTVDNLISRAVASLRGGGGEQLLDVGRGIKDNPLPLALIGIGVGWLIRSQRSTATGYFTESGEPVAKAATGGALAKVRERFSGSKERMSAAREKMAATRERMRDRAEKAREQARKTGGGARNMIHKTGNAISGATTRTRDAIGRTGEKLSSARTATRERIGRTGTAVRGGADRARIRAREVYERTNAGAQRARQEVSEHPVLLGAIGFAIGAVIANWRKRSRMQASALLPEGEHGDVEEGVGGESFYGEEPLWSQEPHRFDEPRSGGYGGGPRIEHQGGRRHVGRATQQDPLGGGSDVGRMSSPGLPRGGPGRRGR